MSGTIKDLKRTFSRLGLRRKAQNDEEVMQQKQEDRALQFTRLLQIWDVLQSLENAHIDEENLEGLDIVVKGLETDDGEPGAARFSRFFIPSSPSFIEDHPIDLDDRENRIGILVMKNVAKHGEVWNKCPISVASSLTSALGWGFDFKRVGRNEKFRFQRASQWKSAPLMPGVFHEAFEDDIVNNRSMKLEDAWQTCDPESKPHVMISIAQKARGIDDKLLRTELTTIVAIMLTRLTNSLFENHTIIPVMVFSLMGNGRGRILQACFTDRNLTIRKSELYDFSTPEEAHPSLKRFLQYLVSDPVGNTARSSRSEATAPPLQGIFTAPSVRSRSSRIFGRGEMSS